MSDSADAIIRRMQDVRRNVGDDVEGIVRTAKTLTDWRYYVRNHPWACVGLALAAGYLIVPKRKQAIDERTKELIALLKKSNLPLAGATSTTGSGMVRSLLAAAAPALTRGAIAMASRRLAGSGAAKWADAPSGHDDVEGINLPR